MKLFCCYDNQGNLNEPHGTNRKQQYIGQGMRCIIIK